MRRRFAGQAFENGAALPADTLAAATEALKQAQAGLKGSRGGRLGPGSQQERDEGAKAVPAVPTMASPTAAQAATPQVNVAALRSALGIDQLLSGLQGLGGGYQAEIPQFEMPEFEPPRTELPNWNSFLSAYEQPEPAKTEVQPQPTQAAGPTKIRVGKKVYNLSRKGGINLDMPDIKFLQNKGWSAKEIKKLASKVPEAGRVVNPKVETWLSDQKVQKQTKNESASATAKSITQKAKQTLVESSFFPFPKQSSKKSKK